MKKIKTIISILLFLLLSTSYSQTRQKESEKIATFCKVWGFLKYYHPTVAKGSLDWDNEFKSRIKSLTLLNTKQEMSNYYSTWINSLGVVKICVKCKAEIPDSLKFNLDLSWLNDTTTFTIDLIKQFQNIQQNRNQKKNYYVQRNIFAGNTIYKNEKPYKDSIFPSTELRLLCLSRYWNIIEYFYPYKYKIGQDWNNVLIEMIPKFKDAKDTIAYNLALSELVAKINDSHAGFISKYCNKYFCFMWAPFRFKLIDNKAIVTGFYNDSLSKIDDIRYGDVFLKVNNIPISEIIQEKSKYIGASNEARKLYYFYYAIFNGMTDSVNVTFERDGKITDKIIHRYLYKTFKYKRGSDYKGDTLKILDGNIGYINMGLLQLKQVNKSLQKLKNTKAIIFDVRNYPNGTMYQIAYFLNSHKQPFAKFTNPVLTYPGVFNYTLPYYCGHPNKNHYQGKVVLLFNEETISHAEFTLMALKTAPNVTCIGSQTAGADGNISLITLPGGYQTYMTGIGVYYPDGRETQRIGIVPDIEVKPTIDGIKSGKDEVLEKAIEIINRE